MKNKKTKTVELEVETTLTNVQLKALKYHGLDGEECVLGPEDVVQVTVNSTPTPKRKKAKVRR